MSFVYNVRGLLAAEASLALIVQRLLDYHCTARTAIATKLPDFNVLARIGIAWRAR